MKGSESEKTADDASRGDQSADRPGGPGAHWALPLALRAGGRQLALVRSRVTVTLIAIIYVLGFLLMGVALLPHLLVPIKVVAIAIGLAFLASAILPLMRPIRCVFDKDEGVLRFGIGSRRNDRRIQLADIVGIETVRDEYVKTPDAEATDAFELRLVLADARRLTIARHAKNRWIPAAARQLAEFLGVPVVEDEQGDSTATQHKG